MTSNVSSNDSAVETAISSALLTRWSVIEATDLYLTPVWYLVGIPGNILAFIVWVQRRMRPSSGCYLAALALDECLFLMMQVTHSHTLTLHNITYSQTTKQRWFTSLTIQARLPACSTAAVGVVGLA